MAADSRSARRTVPFATIVGLLLAGVVLTAYCSAMASTVPAKTRHVTYEPFSANGAIDPSLVVTATVKGHCISDGVAGTSSYRCFSTTRIYDPCYAKPQARSGLLLCSADPASTDVVEVKVSSLPAPTKGEPKYRPWAVELSDGQVCILVDAAWGSVSGPFACTTPPRPAADCHTPVRGDPWWSTACQDQMTDSSPFTTYVVDTVWS